MFRLTTTCAQFRRFNLVFIVTFLVLACLSFAQTPITLSASTFSPLVGNWAGSLKLVDTEDDSTLVVRDAEWQIAANDSGVTHVESVAKLFGLTSDDKTTALCVTRDGKKLWMDGKWWHVSAARETPAGTTMVFEGPAQDNARSAHVRNALYIGAADSVTLTRYVTYAGGGREFVRHQYRMGRTRE